MKTPLEIERQYHVRIDDTDPQGHATMVALGNYLQDSGMAHAFLLTRALDMTVGHDLGFAMTRLRIVMERLPRWQEVVTVATWLSPIDGMYATRNFIITDGTGTRIGSAANSAVLFDLSARRAVAFPERMRELALTTRPAALPDGMEKVAPPVTVTHEKLFQVRGSDLDLMGHVNNVRYIEWALEALPREVAARYDPCEVTLNFQAEVRHGDCIVTRAAADISGCVMTVQHGIWVKDATAPSATVCSRWRER